MAGFIQSTGFFRGKTSSCPSYSPGLYTAEEIDELVFGNGYIPVANINEFRLIESGGSETMGAGTCWEASYTTGLDKKYVQVETIDIGGATVSALDTFTGTYDGNELAFINAELINTTVSGRDVTAFFGILDGGTIDNVRMGNITSTTPGKNHSALLARMNSGTVRNFEIIGSSFDLPNISGEHSISFGVSLCFSGELDGIRVINSGIETDKGLCSVGLCCAIVNNVSGAFSATGLSTDASCSVLRTVGTTNSNFGTGGAIGRIWDTNNSTVVNSSYSLASVTSTESSYVADRGIGGFVGRVTDCIFNDCYGDAMVTTANAAYVSMFAGSIGDCEFNNCYGKGSATGAVMIGGLGGEVNAGNTYNNCYARGEITSSGSWCAGFIAYARTSSNFFNECYSAVVINNGNSNAHAFSRQGTANNTYYDSDLTSLTAGVAVGKTTSELQTPTSNTGIYSAWTIPPWDFGTSSDYPELTTTP